MMARVFSTWISSVIQVIKPWVSFEDIEKGSKWQSELVTKLDECSFGIVCLTKDNLFRPWILFEAGALSKSINGRVYTLLLDVTWQDISQPLSMFNHTTITNKIDVLKLLNDINKYLDTGKLDEKKLEESFEKWWPDLEKSIKSILETNIQEEYKPRTKEEVLEEVLITVRNTEQFNIDNFRLLKDINSRLYMMEKEKKPSDLAEALARLSFKEQLNKEKENVDVPIK